MKTNKLLLGAAILFAAVSLGAINPANPARAAAAKIEVVAPGVTAATVIAYLKGAPHYHLAACCAVPIPGTSNWSAQIGGGQTATVYVEDGIIVGHNDGSGYCN